MDVTEQGNRLKRNATTATACTENTRLTTGSYGIKWPIIHSIPVSATMFS
jgi:hypothetical protein